MSQLVRCFPLCPMNWTSVEDEIPSLEVDAKIMLEQSAPAFCRRLLAYRDYLPEVLHIRGLVSNVNPVPTFYDGQVRTENIWVELIGLLGVLSLLNLRLVGYSRKNGGRILRSVSPTPKALNQLGSQGSVRPLPMHLDNADLLFPKQFFEVKSGRRNSARFLAWLILNEDLDAPIEYVRIHDAINLHLDPSDIGWLSGPFFNVYPPDSIGKNNPIENLKVLIPDGKGGFVSRFNQAKIEPRNFSSNSAFKRFSKTINDSRIRRTIFPKRGDLVILDNFRCVHGRNKFLPRDDGTDRQMIRVYAANEEEFDELKDYISPEFSNGRILIS